MRENVVPYAMSLVFIFGVCICVAAYGLYRQFFVKKTSYGVYDENGGATNDFQNGGGAVPMEEFTPAPAQKNDDNFADFSRNQVEVEAANTAPAAAAKPANPFKKETNVTTNPFNQ